MAFGALIVLQHHSYTQTSLHNSFNWSTGQERSLMHSGSAKEVLITIKWIKELRSMNIINEFWMRHSSSSLWHHTWKRRTIHGCLWKSNQMPGGPRPPRVPWTKVGADNWGTKKEVRSSMFQQQHQAFTFHQSSQDVLVITPRLRTDTPTPPQTMGCSVCSVQPQNERKN